MSNECMNLSLVPAVLRNVVSTLAKKIYASMATVSAIATLCTPLHSSRNGNEL